MCCIKNEIPVKLNNILKISNIKGGFKKELTLHKRLLLIKDMKEE